MYRYFIALLLLAATANADGPWIKDGAWVYRIPNPLPMGDGFARFDPTEDDYISTGARRATEAEIAAQALIAQEAAEEAEEARVAALAQVYGGAVETLAYWLAQVGWTIPCDPATVTADLLAKARAGLLTEEQRQAKAEIADIFILLSSVGVGPGDIAAIWGAIQQ